MKPSYQIWTSIDISAAKSALETAASFIADSIPYTNRGHVCHPETVSDYNRITSAIIALDEMLNRWEAE